MDIFPPFHPYPFFPSPFFMPPIPHPGLTPYNPSAMGHEPARQHVPDTQQPLADVAITHVPQTVTAQATSTSGCNHNMAPAVPTAIKGNSFVPPVTCSITSLADKVASATSDKTTSATVAENLVAPHPSIVATTTTAGHVIAQNPLQLLSPQRPRQLPSPLLRQRYHCHRLQSQLLS